MQSHRDFSSYSSAFLLDNLAPTITTSVLKTSDAECIASETSAIEFPINPEINFTAVSKKFIIIVLMLTL